MLGSDFFIVQHDSMFDKVDEKDLSTSSPKRRKCSEENNAPGEDGEIKYSCTGRIFCFNSSGDGLICTHCGTKRDRKTPYKPPFPKPYQFWKLEEYRAKVKI